MRTLGLLKENSDVNVVALTPENVKVLSKYFAILVEKDAGKRAGFSDQEYALSWARIVTSRSYLLNKADIIVTLRADVNYVGMNSRKVVISGYQVLDEYTSVLPFTNEPIDLYSLWLLPKTTETQSMDIQSSLDTLSGYQAVLYGFDKSKVVSSLMSRGYGTLGKAKVLVLGAGVAGLQAIATAKKLGALVNAFDLGEKAKTKLERAGASFIEGAHAIDTDVEYKNMNVASFLNTIKNTISSYLKEADLVVSCVSLPGKKAPIFITREMLSEMKPGSVVFDLAAETGGNCQMTKNGHSDLVENVLLIGDSSAYNRVARSASILIGNSMRAFIEHFLGNEASASHDEILSSTLVTRKGKIVHQQLCDELNRY